MADALTALFDLTSSDFGEVNITDETFQTITSGTGIEATHSDVGTIKVKNASGSPRNFTIEVPTPVDSGLSLIAKTITDKSYTVPNGKTIEIANMGAYKDTGNNQKMIFDASGTGVSVLVVKPVNPDYKGTV